MALETYLTYSEPFLTDTFHKGFVLPNQMFVVLAKNSISKTKRKRPICYEKFLFSL